MIVRWEAAKNDTEYCGARMLTQHKFFTVRVALDVAQHTAIIYTRMAPLNSAKRKVASKSSINYGPYGTNRYGRITSEVDLRDADDRIYHNGKNFIKTVQRLGPQYTRSGTGRESKLERVVKIQYITSDH